MTNYIHPTSIVHPSVKLGKNNHIGPYCHIYACVEIGDGNHFEGYSSIGSPAEKEGFLRLPPAKHTHIGDNNTIREFVTINAGSRRPTAMGDNCLMLRGSHLSHDSVLEDNVTISCNVMIGGESHIMTGTNIGLSAVLHQFSVIGSYCMIGMGSVCTKKLEAVPGWIYFGSPANVFKENKIGISRRNITDEDLANEVARWKSIKENNRS